MDVESRRRSNAKRRKRRVGPLVTVVLLIAAVITELRKPVGDRTWEGRIIGVIPYDLRRPTLARARARLWNPEDPHILVPTVFGVGWTINLGRLLRPTSGKLLNSRDCTSTSPSL